MRADRLVSLVLLLQARGRMTAAGLAAETGVSVRTIYRDLAALSAAGVPVLAESGPGGGCQLLDGYRFPLRSLRPEEAEALLILAVPGVLAELGLDSAMTAARRQLRASTGLPRPASGPGQAGPLVHLDMPRWFRSQERVPQLLTLAGALRRGRQAELRYERPVAPRDPAPRDPAPGDPAPGNPAAREPARRVVAPLGLVNKAGTWYLVASTRSGRVAVFRAGRITSARILAAPAARPAGFELGDFWQRWSQEFAATRPRLPVRLRASPTALAAFGEVFGDEVQQAISEAGPPDEQGWRELTLSFEHELAAAHRLAGFGGQVHVLSPPAVAQRLVAAAGGILARYGAPLPRGRAATYR